MKKFLLLSAGLAFGMTVMAQTTTKFNCVADTWIRESAPGAKNGSVNQVELGTDGDDATARGGLFSFSFNLESGKKVQSATLHLVSKLCRNGAPVIVYAYPNDFSEADACWDTENSYYAQAVAGEPITQFTMAGQGNKATWDTGINEENQSLSKWYNDIDVTNYVKTLSPTTKRVNFLLTQNALTRFYSKENTGEDVMFPETPGQTSATADELMPYLLVTFVDDADVNVDVILPNADTQIRWNNKDNKATASAMEIYTRLADGVELEDENPTFQQEFYGLIRFNLPSEILDATKYEFTGAQLRLVTVQMKRDRNMELYEYGNSFPENTIFENEESYVRSALASTPVATFEAKGAGNWSMGDNNRFGEEYATAEAWTNYIDLTDYVAEKAAAGASEINLLIKRRDNNPSNSGDAIKIATKEAEDIHATLNDDAATEVTFAAEDLWPQLTVTYTKIAQDEPQQPSAVEVVLDVNAPAEYYNLQGVRVLNPDKGIYIVRQGNIVKKVVL